MYALCTIESRRPKSYPKLYSHMAHRSMTEPHGKERSLTENKRPSPPIFVFYPGRKKLAWFTDLFSKFEEVLIVFLQVRPINDRFPIVN